MLLAYAEDCKSEDWKTVIQERKQSPMHIVMPISLTVNLHKCMVTDDPRLPKMKVCAELGQIDVQFRGMLFTVFLFHFPLQCFLSLFSRSSCLFCFEISLLPFLSRGSFVELD